MNADLDRERDARSSPEHVLRVGLTGNIAAGKSTVAAWLVELGCHVIDADAIGHACLAPEHPAHAEVVSAFGDAILTDDGTIDRHALGDIVFDDVCARRRLEAILHPRIRHREDDLVHRFARSVGAGIAVTEAALLYETGGTDRYHRIVVVVAPDRIRRQRLLERGVRDADARRRMAAQMPQERKAARADYVIDNGGELAHARTEVEALTESLRQDLEAICRGRPLVPRGANPNS